MDTQTLRKKIENARGKLSDKLEVLKAKANLKGAEARAELNEEQRNIEAALGDLGEAVKGGWDDMNDAAAKKLKGWLDKHGN